jgi:DNA-binding ferritin-like protein
LVQVALELFMLFNVLDILELIRNLDLLLHLLAEAAEAAGKVELVVMVDQEEVVVLTQEQEDQAELQHLVKEILVEQEQVAQEVQPGLQAAEAEALVEQEEMEFVLEQVVATLEVMEV